MPRRLIDLTHVIRPGMTTDPRLPAPIVKELWTRPLSAPRYAPGVSFQISTVEFVQNTGTYLDAPYHRYDGAIGTWNLPLDRCADLPGALIDLRAHAAAGARAITPEPLEPLDLRGQAVVILTGWHTRWGHDNYRDNSHPFLTAAAATLLVEKGAALYAIDTINADDFDDLARPVHSILLKAGIPIVENLADLSTLADALSSSRSSSPPSPSLPWVSPKDLPVSGSVPHRSFRFTAAPLPIEGLGSCPCRAHAIVE